MTDEFLMLSVKQEDLDKAAILYERYKKKMYNFFLYKNYNDQERSEDCVQQVFYRVIKYRHTYREGSNFKIWIYSIARNIQYQDYKDQVKMNEIRTNYLITEEYEDSNDDYQAIQKAMKILPEAHREVLLMAKFLGLKYEEIAQIHDCSVGVIKTRVFRAMKSLREIYLKIS
jgi:RNA polymerase sigma factor (sigma-70 family)